MGSLFQLVRCTDTGTLADDIVHARGNSFESLMQLICLGILTAYLAGLPYAGHEEFYLHIGGYAFAWWRIMLAAPALVAALQVHDV